MNKTKFIKELSKKLNLDIETCTVINQIFEDNFIISKSSKKRIINDLIVKLNMTDEEADNIYNTGAEILAKELKNKLLHPFKNMDK